MSEKILFIYDGECPFCNHFAQLLELKSSLPNLRIFDGRKNKILNNKINLKIPIVLFHGKKDDVVPVSYSRRILKFCKKSRKKLIVIPNGRHSLSRKSDLNKICRELKNMVKELT